MRNTIEQAFQELNWSDKQQDALAKWLLHGGAADLFEMAKESETIKEIEDTLIEIKEISSRIKQIHSESK